MIVVHILLLIAGFVGLIKGADIFVNGSSALARIFKVPTLIIGLTIVALGTSAPELAVSISAAIQGSNEIALSNVVGSNLFNLLCVLGVCAVIAPLPVGKSVLKRDFPVSLFPIVLLLIFIGGPLLLRGSLSNYQMTENVGTVTRILGLIFLVVFIAYIIFLIWQAKKQAAPDSGPEVMPVGRCILFIVIGIVLIIAGGQAVVYGAKEIARAAGMTETLIGLTIVAVGTSLPELVTSIVAAKKGETELAVGNVVGSNILNLLFILGTSALIHPVAVNMASVCDMAILLFISVLTLVFSLTAKKINRGEGIVMILLYVGQVLFAIFR